MFAVAFVLALISFLCIYLEFFLPGLVVGVIGGLLLFLSFTLFVLASPPLYATLSYLFFLITIVFLIVRLALYHLRKSSFFSSFDQQKKEKHSYIEKELIGEIAIALTDLRPSGYIEINRSQYQAISQDRFIEKGEKVIIISSQATWVVVKKK